MRMKSKNIFKAALLIKPKSKLKIINNIQIPKLKRGQVLVKLAYSGVCYSQIMEIDGLRGHDKYLPHLLGHEGSGKVIKLGKDVKKVKINDNVVLSWIKGKGLDVPGAIYKKNNLIINSGPITTFGTYTVVSENRIFKVPKYYTMKEAVLFGCAIPTGAGMVFKNINSNKNNIISINGIGGVGLMSLLAAISLNFKIIIAIDTNTLKLKLAKKIGATHIINPKKESIKKTISKITKNQGVDYGIDAAGKVATIENTFSILNKKFGRCIFCSHPVFGQKIQIDPFELINGKKIEGSWGGSINPDYDIFRIAKKFLKFKKHLNNIISKEYSLDNINKAIDDLRKGKVLRPLIVLDNNNEF